MTLRNRLQEQRTRWRRWRLLRAYSRVSTVKTGKRVEVTFLVAAYERTGRDGIFSFSDGEIVWNWPQDGGKV